MTVSKKWVAVDANRKAAAEAYRDLESLAPLTQIARSLGTSFHNVQAAVKAEIPEAERKALQSLRRSKAKVGDRNPMKGKTREQHHNWVGECEDGRGYLTVLHNGKRQFVHRVVMAEALGISELPRHLEVHHIDGDPKNNSLDNLALCTRVGHSKIHSRELDSLSLQLKRSTLMEALRSTT